MAASKSIRLSLPKEAWVFSCSDLHLSAPDDANQQWVLSSLTDTIKANFNRPGVIVLNGDIIELWHPGSNLHKTLQAHTDFWKLLHEYANAPSHKVIYVVGNHDGELAWNEEAIEQIERATAAKVTLELELSLGDAWKQKKLIFNHSNQLDPDNAFVDQFDPNDFPFGKYVVQIIIPAAKDASPALFANIDHLIDRSAIAKVVWSRIFYKYLAPLVGLSALILVVSALIYDSFNLAIGGWQEFVIFVLMTAMVLILLGIFFVTVAAAYKLNRAKLAHFDNTASKKYLAGLADDVVGYITGHTHHPEMKKVRNKLFANSGYGNLGLIVYPGRIGLPNGTALLRNVSWVELNIAPKQIEANLTVSNQKLKSSWIESVLTRVPNRQLKTHEYQEIIQNV